MPTEFDKHGPEGYAALWGCDPRYDHAPRLPGDGYLFYNFGSEIWPRTVENLTDFLGAIERTLLIIESRDQGEYEDGADCDDLDSLSQLKEHVETLIQERTKAHV